MCIFSWNKIMPGHKKVLKPKANIMKTTTVRAVNSSNLTSPK